MVTQRVNFNKNNKERSHPSGYKQPSNWRRNPTIGTSQYEALIVMNNILKFHQDRAINNPQISNEMAKQKASIFFCLLSLSIACTFRHWFFSLSGSVLLPTFFFLLLSKHAQCVLLSFCYKQRAAALCLVAPRGLVPHIGERPPNNKDPFPKKNKHSMNPLKKKKKQVFNAFKWHTRLRACVRGFWRADTRLVRCTSSRYLSFPVPEAKILAKPTQREVRFPYIWEK